jgi:hypothetical protein
LNNVPLSLDQMGPAVCKVSSQMSDEQLVSLARLSDQYVEFPPNLRVVSYYSDSYIQIANLSLLSLLFTRVNQVSAPVSFSPLIYLPLAVSVYVFLRSGIIGMSRV